MMILLLFFLLSSGECVVSPLEKLSDDVKTLQETLTSIQASLMTSVGLIQDQVTEMGHRLTGQFEAKLVSLDKKMDSLTSNLNAVKERAGQWESLQPHLQVLSTRTTEIEQKLDHFSRTHADQLSEHSRGAEFRLEGITRKMVEVGSQVQVLDNRMIGLQDKVGGLTNIEMHLKNITLRSIRHRGAQCHDTKHLLEGMSSKVDRLISKLTPATRENAPSFEYLRSDPPAPHLNTGDDDDHNVQQEEAEFGLDDSKFAGLVRKIVIPYKRTNKRLKDIEMEQVRIEGRLENKLTEMETKLHSQLIELTRKFTDYSVSNSDRYQEHTHIIEGYGTSLAAVLQCCRGNSADNNRFTASASPILDRLDSWMVTWRGEVNQMLEKIQQQDQFYARRIEQEHKNLEKLMIEGLDSKKSAGSEVMYMDTVNQGLEANLTVTTTETVYPAADTTPKIRTREDGVVMDCSGLLRKGNSQTKVYKIGMDRDFNRGGRDYYSRLCDLDTLGGGWTIIQNRGDYGEPRINFTASWEQYKHGFGDLQGEFWFGNDYISRLTGERSYELRIELEAWDGRTAYAEYSTFRVDGEESAYKLWVGGYSGNATDSFSVHNGHKFSTVDRNNDNAPPCCPCSPAYGGGWWFYSCFESNLNGEYFTSPRENGYYRGIIWEMWLGDYSLKGSRMMIRPRDLSSMGESSVPPDP